MNDSSVISYEDFTRQRMNSYHAPGMAVAVARDGKVTYEQGFGWRDSENELPVTSDTIFGIGSITKSFTCVAILQLAESGMLAVDDCVVKYLPEFRTPDPELTKRMTLHHFMTHTSGLPPMSSLGHALARSMKGDPAAENDSKRREQSTDTKYIDTYEQLMDFIRDCDFELLGEPGQKFSYSNDAFALLGAVIERVSGQSYADYMTEHILIPAGMHRSTFSPEVVSKDPNVNTLYALREVDGREEVYPAPIWWDAPAMLAAGFLKSTASDMLRYAEIFRTGGLVEDERILPAESVRRMMQPYIACDPDRYYGYGLMLSPKYHGVSLVEHGGALKGIAAQLSVVPEEGITGVALANLAGVPSFEILLGAINEQLGLPIDTKRKEYTFVQLPRESHERYVGRYVSGEGAEMNVELVDGELEVVIQGKRYPIQPVTERLYVAFIKETEQPVEFLIGEDGTPSGVYFHFRILRKA